VITKRTCTRRSRALVGWGKPKAHPNIAGSMLASFAAPLQRMGLRARLPRFDFADTAQHVVQRGNDCQPCVASEVDYQHYRQELAEAAVRHGCAVHAYVLMSNHVHLLVTPAEVGGGSRMMQAIGRRYVACFNARYRRTGTLWEGRFKSALVYNDRYLLLLSPHRLNPMRVGRVSGPHNDPWSSHARNAYGSHDPSVTPHVAYLRLGSTDDERQHTYQQLIAEALDPKETADLRTHNHQQRVLGATASAPRSKPSPSAPPTSARAAAQDHPKNDRDTFLRRRRGLRTSAIRPCRDSQCSSVSRGPAAAQRCPLPTDRIGTTHTINAEQTS
jgi:putative transposase